ncbi:hypothetical protein JVT61DRAFT_8585 [Boletus reticuloceps]|uniref:ferric-chelate reductase (NADPH) n=1 Tax=Boletus reticuloceps TaxID=495285 RepID=A0A8I3ACK5_9AGAM|nr:hypothetical protein JVT61DRAFT_8585 [Boletus reticuloceps]
MPTNPATSAATLSKQLVYASSLVYRIDIFLLLVILVFATFNAPRAISRFAHHSEWLQGHILRSVKLTRKSRINLNTRSIYLHSDPQKIALDLDDDRTDAMHLQSIPYLPPQSTHVDKELPPRPMSIVAPASTQRTWHMPMLSSLIHPVSSLLHKRMHENYSLGQVPLDGGIRGWVSTSQLPFIYVLATKNNVIGLLVGVGYEKLNYLHRFAGLFAVLAANIHAIGYFYEWSITGTISMRLSNPHNLWGLVSLVCMDILGIFSMQLVRSKFYHFFLTTHVMGLILCNHHSVCIPYVTVACVFYGLDHLVRAIKTRIATATFRPIPELGLTRVEVPTVNAGWRAGQHVRLRVLSTAMGLLGMVEVHPFTIASVSETEEGLVLLCKKTGKWTTKMYEMASTSAYGEQGQEVGRKIKVIVEGPYGGVCNTVIPSYSGAMFVVGGSGITFALSAVQDLVRSGESSSVTDIDVIWCIADPGLLIFLVYGIKVFYTRAPTKSFDGVYLPPGITLVPGRPAFVKHLESLVHTTLSGGGRSGVFVGVCGPVSLAWNVCDTVRCFDPNLKRAVGGVELHEE